MTLGKDFVGTSQRGDIQEALGAAITIALAQLKTDYLLWKLKVIDGSFGGFVLANDLRVTIEAGVGVRELTPGVAATPQWHAWHDLMPGPGAGPTLHVAGSKVMPTPGYTIELRPVNPQGTNPTIYLLEEVITPPAGPTVQVLTDTPVHYRELTTRRYDSVVIQPDGISVIVTEVS